MSNTDDIVKIVYFDEGSATDYVQLKTGGSFMSEIATTDDKSAEGGAEIKGSVGVRAWFANLVKGSASAEGSLSASFKDDTVVKSIVTNTVLTDFLAAVDGEESDKRIEKFDNCKIVQIPGSISSLSLLTPYLWMERKAISELKSSITAKSCKSQDPSLASLCSLPICRCFGAARA